MNITHYSSEELSLHFLNDEGLYHELECAARKSTVAKGCNYIKEVVDMYFVYTSEQLDDLFETVENEHNEYWGKIDE